MRLHRLTVTAFGPFDGTVEVDVDDVARDGLFLLWGPTGSGKTTLLDAVVFALYGTVPGVRGHEKRLRSDHARAEVRTEVTCELSLAGERVRVTRRPEQGRPKKRGAGTTLEPARLVVSRATPSGWEPVSTRIDEGSEYLGSRIGLTAEQFCQVVLLPQGDFARFLRAEPEDRARLLATLFDVGRFARVEDWLAGERRAAEAALDTQRVTVSTLLARVAQTADVDVPELLAPELVGADPTVRADAWVTGIRAAAGERLAEADAAAVAAAAGSSDAEGRLAAARVVADRHARRDRLRAEQDRLTAAEAGLAPLRDRRDTGRRAEGLRDVLETAGRTSLAVESAAAQLAAATAAWERVAEGTQAEAATARRLRDDAAAVRALLPEDERADRLRRTVAVLSREVEELAARCAAGERSAAEAPAAIAGCQEELDRGQAASARLPDLRAAAEQVDAAAQAAAELERVVAGLPELHDRADATRQAWLTAREHLVEVRTRRLDGMAAELAAGLTEGAGCPVCGSAEHPAPAESADGHVSAQDEERARTAVDAAEAAAVAAREAVAERDRRVAVLHERADDRPLPELTAALAAARRELTAAATEAAAVDQRRNRMSALVAARDAQQAALRDDRERLQARRAELAALEAALAEVAGRLDAARGADPDLPSRERRLTAAAERCEAVLAARDEERRARSAADAAQAAAEQRALSAGFPDVAAAAGALLEPGELAALERRIEEHERARAAVAAALAEPDLADLPPQPDLTELQHRCAELTARREDAVAAREQARRCAGALDGLAGDLVAAEVRLDERRAAWQQVSALADLVNGRGANLLRMRLQSFVLAARLEQVAEVASRRLRDMSGGRYTFLHSDAQGRHGARGGLGLDVLDEYTGLRRPTKTLSGGESFMASLALALGLADVVTAESGGVPIDTLFVDEGFGTLDARALDAVMTVLDELRRGGRTVGVISHVEEMRTRIPARVEVQLGRHGSRLAG